MTARVAQILILAMPLVGLATARAASLPDVTTIAGKTMSQVAQHLGKPGPCSKAKHGPTCKYRDGQVEVVFIDGKADWITINGLEGVPFSDQALQAIGLVPKLPSFSTSSVKRWTSIQGLSEVSVFKGQVNADYAYVKVRTR
jgi:hypothetical protein